MRNLFNKFQTEHTFPRQLVSLKGEVRGLFALILYTYYWPIRRTSSSCQFIIFNVQIKHP